MIDPQLLGGHVEIPLDDFLKALPDEWRRAIYPVPETKVWIPLDEIFQNLPTSHLFYMPPLDSLAEPAAVPVQDSTLVPAEDSAAAPAQDSTPLAAHDSGPKAASDSTPAPAPDLTQAPALDRDLIAGVSESEKPPVAEAEQATAEPVKEPVERSTPEPAPAAVVSSPETPPKSEGLPEGSSPAPQSAPGGQESDAVTAEMPPKIVDSTDQSIQSETAAPPEPGVLKEPDINAKVEVESMTSDSPSAEKEDVAKPEIPQAGEISTKPFGGESIPVEAAAVAAMLSTAAAQEEPKTEPPSAADTAIKDETPAPALTAESPTKIPVESMPENLTESLPPSRAPWMRGFQVPPPRLFRNMPSAVESQSAPEAVEAPPISAATPEAKRTADFLASQAGIFAAAAFIEGAVFASEDFPRKPDLDALREFMGLFIEGARGSGRRLGWNRVLSIPCEQFHLTAVVRDTHFIVALHHERVLALETYDAVIAAADNLGKAAA